MSIPSDFRAQLQTAFVDSDPFQLTVLVAEGADDRFKSRYRMCLEVMDIVLQGAKPEARKTLSDRKAKVLQSIKLYADVRLMVLSTIRIELLSGVSPEKIKQGLVDDPQFKAIDPRVDLLIDHFDEILREALKQNMQDLDTLHLLSDGIKRGATQHLGWMVDFLSLPDPTAKARDHLWEMAKTTILSTLGGEAERTNFNDLCEIIDLNVQARVQEQTLKMESDRKAASLAPKTKSESTEVKKAPTATATTPKTPTAAVQATVSPTKAPVIVAATPKDPTPKQIPATPKVTTVPSAEFERKIDAETTKKLQTWDATKSDDSSCKAIIELLGDSDERMRLLGETIESTYKREVGSQLGLSMPPALLRIRTNIKRIAEGFSIRNPIFKKFDPKSVTKVEELYQILEANIRVLFTNPGVVRVCFEKTKIYSSGLEIYLPTDVSQLEVRILLERLSVLGIKASASDKFEMGKYIGVSVVFIPINSDPALQDILQKLGIAAKSSAEMVIPLKLAAQIKL